MKYKMIVSDLDKTLNNDQHMVSDENIAAIKKAVDAGIHFVLCSGRSQTSLSPYGKKLGLTNKGQYGVAFNGSVLYEADTGKTLSQTVVNKELAVKIIRDIKSVGADIQFIIYLQEKHILSECELEHVLFEYKDTEDIKVQVVENLEDHIVEDVIGVGLTGENEQLMKVRDELLKIENKDYNIVPSGPVSIDFMPSATNKARGMELLAKRLGIELDEIVSVGDNYNDIEMIKEAGLGIAVANAVQPLKDVANYITKLDNNNHLMTEVVDLVLRENEKL